MARTVSRYKHRRRGRAKAFWSKTWIDQAAGTRLVMVGHTIIRARRRQRFLIIDQRAVEDIRLSLAARGLLSYLLSRPDDWKVLVKDLQRRGDLRRDGIYKLLKELREAGYVRFQRARDREGRIRGGTYYVSEIAAPPQPDLPDTA